MSCFETPLVIGYRRVPDPPARTMPLMIDSFVGGVRRPRMPGTRMAPAGMRSLAHVFEKVREESDGSFSAGVVEK
jgi:hypothetical protein